jgi:hypothetical protein
MKKHVLHAWPFSAPGHGLGDLVVDSCSKNIPKHAPHRSVHGVLVGEACEYSSLF